MGPARSRWWCALAVAACAPLAPAADTPAGLGRTVERFTFEEPDNPLPVPKGWFRSQSDPAAGIDRPGFPVWNQAHLDSQSPAFEGRTSVRLPVAGGSAGLTLAPGVIPVFPAADYEVTAAVRTSSTMRHARAVLAARLLDQRGQPIPGAEFRSEPLLTAGAWRRISVAVLGDAPDAAYLQVQLLTLQPQQLQRDAPPRPFRVWDEDFDAAAWFDDVTVVQEPRLELTTTHPANTVLAPARPELIARVRDLAREPLTVDVAITDLHGRTLDRERRTLSGGRLETRWTPRLTEYGWYRAHLTLTAAGVRVGSARCDLLWLPDPAAADPAAVAPPHDPDRARFGLHTADLPRSLRPDLTAITRAIGSGAVTLPLWSGEPTDDHEAALARIVPLIESLHARHQHVTIAIERLPPALARDAGVDPAEVARLLGSDRALWGPRLDPYLDRFGQRVRRWQFGRLGDEWAGGRLALLDQLGPAQHAFAALVPGPLLAIPWSSDTTLPAALASPNRSPVLNVVPGTAPEALAQLASAWLQDAAPHANSLDAPELAIVLHAPDPHTHGRPGIAQLAKAVLALWHATAPHPGQPTPAPTRIDLAQPWTITGPRRPALQPSPALGAWRTLADHLAARRVHTRLQTPQGIHALLLTPTATSDRTGAIVAWRDADAQLTTALELYMGEGDVHTVDLFGNTAPVPRTTAGPHALPLHRVQLSDEPVFIEGIDAHVVEFISSIRLDSPLVLSAPGPHEHGLVIANPWAFPIRGRFFILEPGGHSDPDAPADRSWEITPRVADFAIDAHDRTTVPIAVAFSTAQQAGPKDLVVDVELAAGSSGVIRTRNVFELGLREVRLDVYYRTQPSALKDAPPGARDLIVQAEVTNLSDRPLGVELVAVAPDQPKARVTVATIEPGRTALRSLPFYAAADALNGQDVIVGLTLTDSEGRLNRSVRISD